MNIVFYSVIKRCLLILTTIADVLPNYKPKYAVSFANKQNLLAQESLEKCYLQNVNIKTGSDFNSKLIKGVYNGN